MSFKTMLHKLMRTLDGETVMSDETTNTNGQVDQPAAPQVFDNVPTTPAASAVPIPQIDLTPIVINLDYELSVTSAVLNIIVSRFVFGNEGQKELLGIVEKIREEVAKNIKAKYPTLNLVFNAKTPNDTASNEPQTVQ